MNKIIKKICLVILCSVALVPSMRADGILAAIAGYGTLYQLGSSHPGWLTFPALVGGAVCAKVVDACCLICSPKARQELDDILIKASSATHKKDFEEEPLSPNSTKITLKIGMDDEIDMLINKSTSLRIIKQIDSVARILGTVATAYGLTLIKK